MQEIQCEEMKVAGIIEVQKLCDVALVTKTEVEHEEDESEQQKVIVQGWDDVSGLELIPGEVKRVRAQEMECVQRKGVWTKIPRWLARQKGWKIIKTQ